MYFNSQPHEEADAEVASLEELEMYFNSQPHEEADYIVHPPGIKRLIFQLAASRGG